MSATSLSIKTESLKAEVIKILQLQGYELKNNAFILPNLNLDEIRSAHNISRAERITENIKFLESSAYVAKRYMINSSEIELEKIKPELIEIKPNTEHENLYRWWNLTWWSLPHEKSYGRQMRFLVWDEHHNAPIGLIGLQSPILRWSVRDNYLGIDTDSRDFWVNQSMNAQRLGALPPYNKFLGGKLVALLMSSDFVRDSFYKKYKNYKTLIKNRSIPANLLFITTTGAYGKSSVYNRLNYSDHKVCKFIGYTKGHGSFHIPNSLYEGFIDYLKDNGIKAGRSFGNGPSVKLKIIDRTMRLLGFKNGNNHSIKRAIYLFPFANNLEEVIRDGEPPAWYNRDVQELSDFWKKRWAVKRTRNYPKNKTNFSKVEFIHEIEADLKNCQNLIKSKIC